jgi:short-subunit dehydrogenase involved in D-alanine esterification of teichoic acids
MDGSVLIVGGTAGIGLEVARHYAGEGKQVVITGRDDARAKTAAAELSGRVSGIGFDLADPVSRHEAALGVGAVGLELRAVHGEPQAFAALEAGVHA